MNRCALYCRVSLEEQVEKFGLDSQARSVREYADAKQYEAQFVFSDEGYSGADLDRPGLEQLRSAIRTRAIDVVICHDPDRLSRKLAHLAIIQDECERYSVRLEFVTTQVAPTAEGRMFLSLKGIFAEYEREKIRERTLRGRREKARQGFIVGGTVPYGYRYLGKSDGQHGQLVVVEEQAVIVRQIFAWCLDGCSVREITVRLNDAGIPPKFASRWGKSAVGRLLRNETYVGTAYYNRRQRSEPDNAPASHVGRRDKKTIHRMRRPDEWICIPVPAIVDRAVFDQVALRLRANVERLSGRPAAAYLLRGLLYCGRCNRKMGACPMHGVRFYRCAGRERLAASRCNAGTVKSDRIERAVWESIARAFRDPKALVSLITRHQPIPQISSPDVSKLTQRIEQIRRREFRATQALVDCDLADQYQAIKDDLTAMRAQRRRLDSELAALHSRSTLPTDVDGLCQSAARAVDNLNPAERQEFVKTVVVKAVYRQEAKSVDVHCVLPTAVNRSDHQHVVATSRSHLECPLGGSLAFDIAEIG